MSVVSTAVSPTTTLQTLRAYLASLLDVPAESLDIDATLFELGANSMTLLETLGELEQRYDRRIHPREVFEEHNTLRKLAALLDQPRSDLPKDAPAHGELPNQSQVAFLRGFSPGAYGAYTETCCIFLPHPPALSQVARAARTVLQAHPTLARVPTQVQEHGSAAADAAQAAVMREVSARTDQPFALHWVPVQDGSAYLLGVASAELLDAATLRQLLGTVLANVHGEAPPATLRHPGAAFAAYRASPEYAAQRVQALQQVARSTDLALPHDKRRPAVKSYAGQRVMLTLPKALQQNLVRHAQAHGGTSSSVVLSAWSAFLARLCRQSQVALGLLSPSNAWEPHQAAAYARSNAVLLALDIDTRQSFATHCQQTQSAALEALQAGCIPFSDLVAASNPTRDPGRSPLFTVAFGSAAAAATLPLGAEEVPLPAPFARYDLQVTLLTGDDSMRLSCVFASDLLNQSTVVAWLRGLTALLSAGLEAPHTALSALPMGPTGLPEAVACGPQVDWGPTRSIAHILQATAVDKPEAIAVQDDQGSWTYRTLARRVRSIAGALQQRGVQPGEHVGVCMHRTRELLASLLGILHAGGTYVPLDPQDPEGRRRLILTDSGARFIIHDDAWTPPAGTITGLAVETLQGPEIAPAHRAANAAAYVIYTSGSTGQPKGVVIGDDNLHNLVAWTAQFFPRATFKRVLASTSICFDLSAFELFPPLLAGTTVVLVDNLFALTEAHDVTFINTVCSLLVHHLHTVRLPQTVRVVCTGGEILPPALAQQLYSLPHVEQVYNLYAPAETTTYSTCSLAARGNAAQVPLGNPLANTQVHLLDEAGHPVLPGVVGEIYLGGAGVSRGYHQRDGLTAERFVTRNGIRLYRTGDQARLSDEKLYFLGRTDHQIKLRGVRIEPKEVEAVLRQHPAVSDVFVRVEEQALVAYVQSPASAETLRAELMVIATDHLTRGALPTRLVVQEALPRLPNGKLDVNQLASAAPATATPARRAPSTEMERRLHAAWREVLQLADIAMDDDFFALGGDSMHMTQLLLDLRRSMNFHLQTAAFLQNPTLATLTAQVHASAAQESRADQAPDRFVALEREASELTRDATPLPAGGGDGPVLLTGATGFLGMRLLVHLLQASDRQVWLLVRAATPEEGLQRLIHGMQQAGLWQPAWRPRITCLCGDLAKPKLGIDASAAARIAAQVTDLLHCGALVNFVYPYAALRATNVLATQAMVDLAAHGVPKTLHHISTIGVWPMGGHRTFKENHPLCTDTPLNLGYDESKWVAECIVQKAGKRGLRTVIYRPGEVAGDSTTGVYATGHYAWAMVRGSLQLGAFPHLECPIDLTPVDYAARAIVWLFLNRRSANETFHITNPAPIHSSDAYAWLRERGYRFDVLPAQAWVKRLMGHADFRHNALFPFAGMLDGMQRENLELPGFDSTLAQKALQGSQIGCLPVAGKLLDTYLDYFIRTGYLPAPQMDKILGDVA